MGTSLDLKPAALAVFSDAAIGAQLRKDLAIDVNRVLRPITSLEDACGKNGSNIGLDSGQPNCDFVLLHISLVVADDATVLWFVPRLRLRERTPSLPALVGSLPHQTLDRIAQL